MKTRDLFAIGLLLSVIATGGSQQAQNANNEFYFFDEWKAKLLEGGKIRLTVAGSPIKADLKTQALKIEANSFEGTVKRTKEQRMAVLSAVIAGNVSFSARRPSSSQQEGAFQDLTLKSALLNFNGETNTVVSPGAISVERSDVASEESLNLSATSGTVRLFEAGISSAKSPFQSFDLIGKVKGKLVDVEILPEDEKTKIRPKPKRVELNLTCNHISYDDLAGKMTLTGTVHLWGNHPVLMGDVEAEKIVLILSSKGDIDEIIVTGSPANTTVTRKPPPARK